MKSARPIWFALILVGVFYFVTTHHNINLPAAWLHPEPSRAAKLEITEADKPLSFDAEEQNNIAVYKRALPSVVNITSTAVAFDFFYGPVPQEGQGSGFIIDKEGHILTNYHVVANAR